MVCRYLKYQSDYSVAIYNSDKDEVSVYDQKVSNQYV